MNLLKNILLCLHISAFLEYWEFQQSNFIEDYNLKATTSQLNFPYRERGRVRGEPPLLVLTPNSDLQSIMSAKFLSVIGQRAEVLVDIVMVGGYVF